MTITKEVLDEDTLQKIKDSFNHVKTKVAMPTNISKTLIQNYRAPTLVTAGEKDSLFYAKKFLSRAQQILPNPQLYTLKIEVTSTF